MFTTHLGAGNGVDEVLELVLLSELGLANQMVELHHGARHQVRLYMHKKKDSMLLIL